ncbi:hypothetical protein FDUTEX481_00507 [Tolypothrix sp. PCC 7601]|nr:hypothetical protein FDUTEX481_00507 [Tolypothrix sp. PCC 7601]
MGIGYWGLGVGVGDWVLGIGGWGWGLVASPSPFYLLLLSLVPSP